MTVTEVVKPLGLIEVVEGASGKEISGGYVSDLLSDVMANAKAGTLWITNQKHQNCVAVASLLDMCGIIIAGGTQPDEDTIMKAKAEQIPLYTSDKSAFDIAGRLYEMGIRGPIQP